MMSHLSSVVKRHPIITFFVLAYAISWVGMPLYAAGIWPIPFLATGPLIAALIVIPITQGLSGLRELGLRMIRWRVRWYWYVVAVGLPLAVLLLTVGLNVALGASAPSLAGVGSLSTILMVFAVRLINPLDGPMGEEPGWRGFALPGLQTTLSPLITTLILAVLITGWHLPTFFLEGGFQPAIFVGGVVGTVAVTFWYTWLFNHTGGSVLLVLLAHATQGTIKIGAPWSASADVAQALLVYAFVASAVAIGLVIFDRKAWRSPADARTTTPPQAIPTREVTPVTPA
jgi:membrane protease YdiL (CAAX protease family)